MKPRDLVTDPMLTRSEDVWAEALSRPSFVAAIEAGLADLKAGRVSSWDDVKARLQTRIPDADWPSPGYLTPEPDPTGPEHRTGE